MLLVFLVIADGFGWKNLSLIKTTLDTAASEYAIESFPMVFFVVTMIVFLIAIIKYALIMAFNWRYPTQYQEFVDLCSATNMSVIMFNEEMQGYYIHGQSGNGSADVDARQLRLNLHQEAIGNASIRGINSDYVDLQTFEMSMPKEVMDKYREIFYTKVATTIDAAVNIQSRNYTALESLMFRGPALPQNLAMRELMATKETMNKLMKSYIDRVRADPKLFIQ